ncbi:VPLPA-CTERM sorting domain-containing protein [Geobacter argillaceus]|uniref:Putative secreted protein n=1 Tax=Geobacter argillaceus TaxID=345631 RepID=A0A562VFN4_9BACT|nr:VPLPA-CTERM sorting domain-containing protein [Geobacter argillaceus]TWJ16692.1 putative secreted protein [Geobacter argillaceus]
MKKKMIALLAGALMTLAASNAMAAFGNAELVRVVYNHLGTVEVATDLGNIDAIIAGGAVAADTFKLSSITGATSTADLYVSYFASNYTGSATTNKAYMNADAAPAMGSYTNFNTGVSNAVNNYYNYLSTTNAGATTVTGQTSYANSFTTQLAKGGVAYGSMNSSLYNSTGGEQNLATLLSTGGKSTIYSFTNFGRNPVTGTSALALTTNFDTVTGIGSTSIAPAATPTPIPAAAYLLGSGLLGLVGIRRKQK